MIKNSHGLATALALAAVCFFSTNALAKSVTFQRKYTYQASEADSKLSCRAIALEQVKRLLLEELGTYLETETEVKNFQLTKDKITTLAAGTVATEIIDERWDGKEYQLSARITADPEEVIRKLDAIRKDRQKVKELESARERARELLAETKRLRKELALVRASGKSDYRKVKQYHKAVNELSATDWYMRGVTYHDTYIYEDRFKAIDAFSNAIKLDPKSAHAYFARGLVYAKQAKFDRAIADLNKCLEIDPMYAEAYSCLGTMYSQKGQNDRAISQFNKALEIDPGLQLAYYNRAVAYFRKGNYPKGLEDLERESDPNLYTVYTTRGNTYAKNGEYDKAIVEYSRALRITPDPVLIYDYRGNAYINNRQYDKAIADYNKILKISPEDARAYNNRGVAYWHLGYKQKAIKDLKVAAELGNKSAQSFLNSKKN